MIYMSTDSLFDGRQDQPYIESDTPRPLNTYARTKLAGESAALQEAGTTVLRTNIFGWSRHERPSFAEWVVKGLVERVPLRMFTDVDYTPIHVTHLASVVADVMWEGPSTYRPDVAPAEIARQLRAKGAPRTLVTHADGTLVGLVRLVDLPAADDVAESRDE